MREAAGAAEGTADGMLWWHGTPRSCARSTALGNAAGMPGAVGGTGHLEAAQHEAALRVCLALQEGQALCRLTDSTAGGQVAGREQAGPCRPSGGQLLLLWQRVLGEPGVGVGASSF